MVDSLFHVDKNNIWSYNTQVSEFIQKNPSNLCLYVYIEWEKKRDIYREIYIILWASRNNRKYNKQVLNLLQQHCSISSSTCMCCMYLNVLSVCAVKDLSRLHKLCMSIRILYVFNNLQRLSNFATVDDLNVALFKQICFQIKILGRRL